MGKVRWSWILSQNRSLPLFPSMDHFYFFVFSSSPHLKGGSIAFLFSEIFVGKLGYWLPFLTNESGFHWYINKEKERKWWEWTLLSLVSLSSYNLEVLDSISPMRLRILLLSPLPSEKILCIIVSPCGSAYTVTPANKI